MQLAVISADAERGAAVVEHDGLVGEGARERKYIAQLRFEQPGVEGQPKPAEVDEAFAERGIEVEALRRMERRAEHLGIGVPCRSVADAPEARGCGLKRFEHRSGCITKPQVGVAHNCSAQPRGAIEPARALCRDAIDVFDFANDLQRIAKDRIGLASAVERAAFHEHRADHVVATGHVGVELVEGVVRGARDGGDERVVRFGDRGHQRPQVPQVVVRIDDGQIRFDNGFGFEDRFGHIRSLVRAAARHRG